MKQYRGLYYEIRKDGREYSIVDRTKVLNLEYDVCAGSSEEPNHYTEEYIKKEIDRLVGEISITIEGFLERNKLSQGYVAMDKNKKWYWYQNIPFLVHGKDHWCSISGATVCLSNLFNIESVSDWRNSLIDIQKNLY